MESHSGNAQHLFALHWWFQFSYLFKKYFIYLFMKDTERERSRDTGRGRSRPHAGSPTWDSIPGPRGHALGWREALNRWATGAALSLFIESRCYLISTPYSLQLFLWALVRGLWGASLRTWKSAVPHQNPPSLHFTLIDDFARTIPD